MVKKELNPDQAELGIWRDKMSTPLIGKITKEQQESSVKDLLSAIESNEKEIIRIMSLTEKQIINKDDLITMRVSFIADCRMKISSIMRLETVEMADFEDY